MSNIREKDVLANLPADELQDCTLPLWRLFGPICRRAVAPGESARLSGILAAHRPS